MIAVQMELCLYYLNASEMAGNTLTNIGCVECIFYAIYEKHIQSFHREVRIQ